MSRGRPRIVRPICGGGEEAAREARFLYIISRERPDLYRRISADFADAATSRCCRRISQRQPPRPPISPVASTVFVAGNLDPLIWRPSNYREVSWCLDQMCAV